MKLTILGKISVGATVAMASMVALAQPSFNQRINGAQLLVFATNGDKRGWSCHANWTVTGDEFGASKSQQMHVDFFVAAGARNRQVVTGGVPALTNASAGNADISCDP